MKNGNIIALTMCFRGIGTGISRCLYTLIAEFSLAFGLVALVSCASPPFATGQGFAGVSDKLGVGVHGFVDTRAGIRLQNDYCEKQESLGEARLQLDMLKQADMYTAEIRADLLYDPVLDKYAVDLEDGKGFIDLREANVLLYPASFMDLKVGRQILTWGTGDLLFINDLFPKDWQSFFIGRDEEYLKAPSDSVLVSLFPSFANLYVAYTPCFDSDRYISGERISYWNRMLGRTAGRDAVVETDKPNRWFRDDEIAGRLSKNLGGYEFSLYGYRGYWKSPEGMDMTSGKAIFPPLAVYGASVRGMVGKGIGNLEGGFYDSIDDRHGDDPLLPNSELRLLAGYEQEIVKNLTGGLQYYLEHMLDYDEYRDNLPDDQHSEDEYRQVLTLRLTQLLMNQNLTLSVFSYYSPTDKDAYVRPNAAYKITDRWLASVGANVFLGEHDYTFFGQFEDNSNVYGALRYSF